MHLFVPSQSSAQKLKHSRSQSEKHYNKAYHYYLVKCVARFSRHIYSTHASPCSQSVILKIS